MISNITVAQLERPEHDGDWHDKPVRWAVYGPYRTNGTLECQKFCTKKEALKYASIRRRVLTERVAMSQWIEWAL